MDELRTLQWKGRSLILLDQTLLPNKIQYITCTSLQQVYVAIQDMIVRGAPAIGVSAAYGMSLAAYAFQGTNAAAFLKEINAQGQYLKQARPTAVNLMWAVDRILNKINQSVAENVSVTNIASVAALQKMIEKEAIAIHEEDKQTNRKIGENLLSLLKDGDTVLTHCNAGSLATSEYGTALSVFYMAQEKGMHIKAYADETRPRLQGASLTAFELQASGIDVTLICNNMAATVMRQGKIDAVIVGCDRVAANGDTANKIGTYSVSILAKYFHIPLYIAAPSSTIDMDCPSGGQIPIEERSADEVLYVGTTRIAPENVKVYNPAFDVTPAENITAIVTEKGIVYPPFKEHFKILL